jgi:hypothetical protein
MSTRVNLLPNPRETRTSRRAWRPYCCPLHAVLSGFSPDRQAHASSQQGTATSPPASLSDQTPKKRSERCNADRSATQGLFERIDDQRLLVFQSARVLTQRAGQVLEHHDVWARAGVIESVHPRGTRAVPEHARVLACNGMSLMPGLSDIHTHPFLQTTAGILDGLVQVDGGCVRYVLPYDLLMFQFLACGITRLEVLAGCPDSLWMRDQVRAGQLIGPTLSVGSPLIDGPPAIHSPAISYVASDHAGGRRAADQSKDMGFDFLKPYTNLPAEAFEGLMQGADHHGLRVMGHVPAAVGIEAAVLRGQRGFAHIAELFYNDRGMDRRSTARRERLVRVMADHGAHVQATMVVLRRMAWMGGRAPFDAPDVAWMNPLQAALWHDASPMMAIIQANEQHAHFYEDVYGLSCLALQAARKAGVRMLTGTDVPNPCVVEGFSLHEELQLMVRDGGYTAADALYASTRQAASYHGEPEVSGTVTAGAPARLIVVEGDPLADINATRRIQAVLAGTHLLEHAAITEGFKRVRRAFDAMPKPVLSLPAAP